MLVRVDMVQHITKKDTKEPLTIVHCSSPIPTDDKFRKGWERLVPMFFKGHLDLETDVIMDAVFEQRVYNGEVKSFCTELLYVDEK